MKVLDFGLARLVSTELTETHAETIAGALPGSVLGTLRYMSPEQARGETVTSTTDIFSMGLVIYELATGQHAFAAELPLQVVNGILADQPVPPSRLNPEIPAAMDWLIAQMLQKDPRLRPSAADVQSALAELAGAGVSDRGRRSGVFSRPLTVGREKELAELRAGFEAVNAGHGLILSVSGEPGSGKTTLVEHFLADLAADSRPGRIARGRCSERLAGSEAYLPWIEALDSLLHDGSGTTARVRKALAPTWYLQATPPSLDDGSAARSKVASVAASQERLKRELAALLRELSQTRPLLLFFEDLHWADASTIDLLAFLADRIDELKLLILATSRTSDLLLGNHPFVQLRARNTIALEGTRWVLRHRSTRSTAMCRNPSACEQCPSIVVRADRSNFGRFVGVHMPRSPLTRPSPVEILEETLDTVPLANWADRHGFTRARSTGDRRCGDFLTRPRLIHPLMPSWSRHP